MISEGVLFVLTIHRVAYYAPPSTLQQIAHSYWVLFTLDATHSLSAQDLNEVDILYLSNFFTISGKTTQV